MIIWHSCGTLVIHIGSQMTAQQLILRNMSKLLSPSWCSLRYICDDICETDSWRSLQIRSLHHEIEWPARSPDLYRHESSSSLGIWKTRSSRHHLRMWPIFVIELLGLWRVGSVRVTDGHVQIFQLWMPVKTKRSDVMDCFMIYCGEYH